MKHDDALEIAAFALADSTLLMVLLSAHLARQPDAEAAAHAILQLCDEKLIDVEAGVATGDPSREMLAAELARRFAQARVRAALALAKPRPSPQRPSAG